MPRNMSFHMTTQQVIDETKDVTRRNGWRFLKTGDILQAVEKGQGLKKGEKINRLKLIRVTKVSFEPLFSITQAECVREGFPNMKPANFIEMYCNANKCISEKEVTRIQFEYVEVL